MSMLMLLASVAAFAAGVPPRVDGGVVRPNPVMVRTAPPITVRPVATASAAVPATATGAPGRIGLPRRTTACVFDLHHIAPGTKVPLSCFPQLPTKSAMNSMTPKQGKHARVRPMAATGVSVDLTAGAGCGSAGALYSVGCSMTWQATNLNDWSTTDTYADYYIPANSTTATLVGTNGYAFNAAAAHATSLSVQGTWSFFVYDTTAQVIVATVYVNAGAPFQIFVYQDPYHTQQAYQFDVAYSQYAYIYLPNVSTTDVYVVYVMSTGVNSYCTYLTPGATPAPPVPSPRPSGAPSSLVCNPNTSPGVSAPTGTLALQWPLNTTYQAGSYSIVVYDKTSGSALGQAQVSLTGIQDYTFQLYPTPAANPTPAVVATPPTTRFAWDSVNEQSVGGVVATVANQIGTAPTNGTYRMVVSDPDGQVVGIPTTNSIPATCTSLVNNSPSCTVSGTFQFSSASPALNTPGSYPNNTWTIQLYAPNNKELEASQAFQIMGYSSQTLFTQNGVNGQTLTFGCCTAGTVYNIPNVSMVFTNNANISYPFAADPLIGIEYTTGPPATLNSSFAPPSNTTGYGVTVALSGCTGTYNTTGCSETVVDSTGGSWTLTDYCSVANPAAPRSPTGSQCVLKFTPQNNTDLVPGASITVPNMTFYGYGGNNGWSCYNVPCSTATSILPIDGLSWSSTNAASQAWTAVYFGSATNTLVGTANAHFIGSATFPGNTARNAVAEATSPPNSPWINTHFYPAPFTQGEYQDTTPFQAATGRRDILAVNLSLCKASANPTPACGSASGLPSIDEVLITFPAGVDATQITVDPSEPTLPDGNGFYVMATTGTNACVNTPPTNAICLNPGGTAYNAGGRNTNQGITTASTSQGQIWLDVPDSEAAYIAQELTVQGYSTSMLAYFTLTPDGHTTTPVVGGGVAGTAVDSLSLQGFSLNANLMGAQFNPSTVSPNGGSTSYSLTFQNTSSAADPNPDPVDAIVIEQATSNAWTLSAPSFSGTGSGGWSNLSTTGYNITGNTMEYWFGVCTNQYTNHVTASPPQPPNAPVNPTSAQPTLGAGCTAAQEQNAVASGGAMTINFTLANSSTGTQTFYVYAHGANGGGWANLKTVTVNSVAESASAKLFSAAQGSTDAACSTTSNVSTNSVAQVAKSPNCFIYEVSNTSGGAQKIGKVDISLPAFDINGIATSTGPPVDWALVGAPVTQFVVLGTISGGTFKTTGIPAGCAINAANTFNPTPGSTNGQIEVSGCTGLSPGTNIAVEFVANTPQVESNSYLLPSTIDGVSAGNAWIGADEVQVAFSLGLSVTVDPTNPGPGNSHPSPSCNPAQCAFSGTVLDFGTIPVSNTVIGTDVVRATVVYEGGSLAGACPAGAGVAANTWQLGVSVSSNPSNELFTSVDQANSTSGLTYAAGVGTFFNPNATTKVLSCGQESSGTNYDTIMNFETSVGADTTAHIITVTYTLISN